jgi:hypothetical protein
MDARQTASLLVLLFGGIFILSAEESPLLPKPEEKW